MAKNNSPLHGRVPLNTHLSKTLHPMGYDYAFTAACSHIMPVHEDLLLPDDKVYCKFNFYGRNILPFLAPASVDFDFHIDYFFVPMFMLYQPFGSVVYEINDEFSANFYHAFQSGGSGLRATLPLFDLNVFSYAFGYDVPVYSYTRPTGVVTRQKLWNSSFLPSLLGSVDSADSNFVEIPSFESIPQRFYRLMDMLGYDVGFEKMKVSDDDSWTITLEGQHYTPPTFPWPILAYNAIYQRYFRDENIEDYRPLTFNVDDESLNIIQYPNGHQSSDWSRALEMCLIKYSRKYSDYFSSVQKSPLINQRNLLMSVGNDSDIPASLASFGQGLLKSNSFLGFLGNEATSNYPLDSAILSGRYTPTDDVSDASPIVPFSDAPLSIFQSGAVHTDDGTSNFSSENYARTTDQLRQLFAVEKMLMLTNRADKNYDAQTLAHFGIKVPHDVKHELTHIGHERVTMHLSEITALAGTETTALGEYAAKGAVGLNSKGIKFTAPCHGVLMTTLRIIPKYNYFHGVLKRNVVQSRLDLYQPEFDSLGMQPLYRYEVGNMVFDFSNNRDKELVPYKYSSDIQGWQYRYSQWKDNFNRVSPAFKLSPLSNWILADKPYRGYSYGETPMDGFSWNGADSTKMTHYQYDSIYRFGLMASPSDTDNIFGAVYNTKVFYAASGVEHDYASLYATDPFIIFSNIDYNKVSVMSRYSMPKLGL